MSEIPVGSPPVPPGRHAAPGGWYADPAKSGQERYWDGWQWTRNVRPAESPTPQGQQTGQGHPTGQGQQQSPRHAAGQAPGQGPYAPQQPGHQQPGQNQCQYGQQQYPQNQWGPQGGRPGQYQLVAPGQRPIPADQLGRPLGNRGLRLLAKIIDGFLIGLLSWLACFPIAQSFLERYLAFYREVMAATSAGQPMPATPPTNELITTSEQLTLSLVTAIVTFVYIFLFLRWKAATPGKLATGLRVVPTQSAERLGTGQQVKRSLLEAACGLFSPVALLNFAFPIWDARRQALHDKVADTLVVTRAGADTASFQRDAEAGGSHPGDQDAHRGGPSSEGYPHQ